MNLLIVEDEPPILRDILNIIQSFHEDYYIMGTATNGQQAVDFLAENGNHIDLILTDIQIPVIDGLELIAYAKEHFPKILCIIITGYSEFEYAKKAISLNVYDYLLKPIDENDLQKQLKAVYEKKYLEYLKSEGNFSDIYHEDESNTGYEYRLAILCLGSFPTSTISFGEVTASWDAYPLAATLDAHADLISSYWIIDGHTSSEKNLLFSYQKKNYASISQLFHEIFRASLPPSLPITIVIDDVPANVSNVKRSVQKLRLYMSRYLILGKSQLLFYSADDAQDHFLDYRTLSSYDTNLSQLFQNRNLKLFHTELKHFLEELKDQSIPQITVSQYLYELLSLCISSHTEIRSIQKIHVNETINDIIALSDSYDTLYENLISVLDDIMSMILNETNNISNKQNTLIVIDHYIKEHYQEPISTKLIAAHFNFTPAYLSKIFRDYKELSPSDYIVKLRIDKAKELFTADPSLLIKDVATFVGYDDSLYFSKVFKKVTHLSPRQFIASFNFSKSPLKT